MKMITERQEIAEVMNFGKYPVLFLDLAKDKMKDFDGCYEAKTKVSYGEYGHGRLCYYGDTKELVVMSDICMLKSSFGYKDIIDMVGNAHSVKLRGEQDVVVVIVNSERQLSAYPFLTKTSKLNQLCSIALRIEGDFSSVIRELA